MVVLGLIPTMEVPMKNCNIRHLRRSGADLAVRSRFLTSDVGPGLDAAHGMADACTTRAGQMMDAALHARPAGVTAA